MDVIKNAVRAGSIAQSAFMPGILQTTNSGKFYSCFISHPNNRLF
jgi:hypothetical protein